MLFFLLPFLDCQNHVDPSTVVVGQYVYRGIVLLFFLHWIYFLSLFALFQPSLDLHRLFLVGFGPFCYLFLTLCVKDEWAENRFTHPFEKLFETLNHLRLGWRFYRFSYKFKLFAEHSQITKSFRSIIMNKWLDDFEINSDNLSK